MSDSDPIVIDGTKQWYRGTRYYLCGFYFQRDGVRLHRLVWSDVNGTVPKGWHVHHINHDRSDNRLENLALMEGREHAGHHGGEPTPARLAAYQEAVPRLQAGNAKLTREQRSRAAREGWIACRESMLGVIICAVCGKEYTTPRPTRTKFCGNNCKARDLRARRRAARIASAGLQPDGRG